MFAQDYKRGVAGAAIAGDVTEPTTELWRVIWWGGGLASILSGALLVTGHLFDFGAPVGAGAVLGKSLILAAHLAMVLALVGIYAAQVGRVRLLGHLGMLLSVTGTALVSGVVLVEIAGAGGADVEAVLAGGAAAALATSAGMAFFIGLILFGIATMRAGVLSRWGGLLLIVGDLVFAAGSGAGSMAPFFTFAGSLLTSAGFAWLGWTMVTRYRQPAVGSLAARGR